MRVIFEEVENEYFFEVILTDDDYYQVEELGGVIKNCIWEGNGIKQINIFLRKEKEKNLCHLLKEKKHPVKKDSQKILNEKWEKENPKNKPLLSLIPKRDEEKRKLLKKEKNK